LYSTVTGMARMRDLLAHASAKELGVNDLADRLGVHRRTVRRWAQALEADEAQGVIFEPGRPGRAARVRLAGVRVPTPRQQTAAGLALAATRYIASTGAEPLEELAENMIMVQAGNSGELVERLRTAFHYIPFGAKSYTDMADDVDEVFSAVVYRHPLRFRYALVAQGAREIGVEAEPRSMVIYRDGLYMLGLRLNYGEPQMRVYAIDRMSQVKMDRSETFEVPADFDPIDHFGDLGLWRPDSPPVLLDLLFSAKVAPFVRERTWPGLVDWGVEGDRHRLRMEIRVSAEVERWIRSFGAEVEVRAPETLRAKLRDGARALRRLYGD